MEERMIIKLGSVGDDVRRLQERLRELGFYDGRIDGIFGGATLSAVKAFQKNEGLKVDGIIGPETARKLFGDKVNELSNLSITNYPLDYRCLCLTGSFETGKMPPECFSALSGNFDGQGISFGALQWNFGQGSLQPLLREMIKEYREVIESIFHDKLPILEEVLKNSREEALEFADSIQHPVKHYIYEPWKGMFRELGRTKEFQAIQLRFASKIYGNAKRHVEEYGLRSERGVALMFDIIVQCGSIKKMTKEKILSDFNNSTSEVSRLEIIALRVSEQVKPRWQDDVKSRKLCIARGEGYVHNILYNLSEQFGISLRNC
jgi:hypothetical protein